MLLHILLLYTQIFPHPPLKSRIVVTSNYGIPKPSEKPHTRPTSYKGWDMDAMQLAVAEVEKGMSQRQAAECYKVPRTTLRDYLSDRSSLSSRSGKPVLSEGEENELTTFLVEIATSNSSSKTRGAAAPRTPITWASFVGSKEPSLNLLRSAEFLRKNSSPFSNCRRSKSAIFISRNINYDINSLLL